MLLLFGSINGNPARHPRFRQLLYRRRRVAHSEVFYNSLELSVSLNLKEYLSGCSGQIPA